MASNKHGDIVIVNDNTGGDDTRLYCASTRSSRSQQLRSLVCKPPLPAGVIYHLSFNRDGSILLVLGACEDASSPSKKTHWAYGIHLAKRNSQGQLHEAQIVEQDADAAFARMSIGGAGAAGRPRGKKQVVCRPFPVGQQDGAGGTGHSGRIFQTQWHPVSASHLMVLNADFKLRLWDLHLDPDTPEQVFEMSPWQRSECTAKDFAFGRAAKPSFCFGSPAAAAGGSDAGAGWESFTVYVSTGAGHVYTVCPVVPASSACAETSIRSLHDATREKLRGFAGGLHGSATEQAQLELQQQWLEQLWLLPEYERRLDAGGGGAGGMAPGGLAPSIITSGAPATAASRGILRCASRTGAWAGASRSVVWQGPSAVPPAQLPTHPGAGAEGADAVRYDGDCHAVISMSEASGGRGLAVLMRVSSWGEPIPEEAEGAAAAGLGGGGQGQGGAGGSAPGDDGANANRHTLLEVVSLGAPPRPRWEDRHSERLAKSPPVLVCALRVAGMDLASALGLSKSLRGAQLARAAELHQDPQKKPVLQKCLAEALLVDFASVRLLPGSTYKVQWRLSLSLSLSSLPKQRQ